MFKIWGIAKCPINLEKAAPQHCDRVDKMAVQLGVFLKMGMGL